MSWVISLNPILRLKTQQISKFWVWVLKSPLFYWVLSLNFKFRLSWYFSCNQIKIESNRKCGKISATFWWNGSTELEIRVSFALKPFGSNGSFRGSSYSSIRSNQIEWISKFTSNSGVTLYKVSSSNEIKFLINLNLIK